MTHGQLIRKRREELNIKQTDLADAVKISKQTLYKYENDIITNIPSDTIEALAKALDTTPAYLMGWEEEKESNPDTILEELHQVDEYRYLLDSLSPEERQQIGEIEVQLVKLTPENRSMLLNMLRHL